MAEVRMQPDKLRETAEHLRYLGGDIDHVRWQVQSAWARLESSWQSAAVQSAQSDYEQASKLLAALGERMYQYAWVLEATAAWAEEADKQAAADLIALQGVWGQP